ncbi:MAG: hypothetical protein H6538_04165 [Bacteroidales bacterium]|nr:hypothetical protein [Bacteroidales bacterium]MCB8998745.1 hypothetical protein [Bacteroidales bacterium]
MPYRRLPNTDNARLKALHTAFSKGKELPPFKLAFSQSTFSKIQSILPSYEHALSENKTAYNLQLEKNKDYHKHTRKARIYVSHFIQVTNLAIIRGDLPANTRAFFGMDEDEKKLPSLQSDEELLEWGHKLIEGEKERRNENHTPITNPTIAVVKVFFDRFLEVYNLQNSLKKRCARAQTDISEKRSAVDSLIQQLWNEIEDTFKDLPEELKREKASDYGVVYVYRKNEMGPVDLFKNARLEIG